MFEKVIVGDDGRDGGADALALARALAPGAELIIASAYPVDTRASRFAQVGYDNYLRDEAERALRQRRDEAGILTARTVAMPDTSPARGLHRLAETEAADLIVLGSPHRGPVGRMLLGDVSRSTLHGSPCPVAVAPRGFHAGPPATIGVAYDRGAAAERALATAAGLAEALAARLVLREVVAADLLPAMGGYPVLDADEIAEELRRDAQAHLDEIVAGLPEHVQAQAQATAVLGTVVSRLDELAGQVDLLVCGSRSWGAFRRVVLGSTADHLIHSAPCPVIVVPGTAEVATPSSTSSEVPTAAA